MARLLADENFPLPTTEALRLLGHEIMTAHEAGLANRSALDAEVLEFARAQRLVLLTLNRKHFLRLHAQRPDHSASSAATSIRTSRAKRSAFTRRSNPKEGLTESCCE